jgi:RNA polymerase sigma-70 factor (sigma-E family)
VSEREEFDAFVERRSNALLRAAWLLTGDWPLAEDLVQTALVATWLHWSSVTRIDAPEVYVRRVMVTTFLRWRRRRWTGEIPTAHLPEPPADDGLHQIELRDSLVHSLDVLSPPLRAVLVLRYFADLPEAQVAHVMDCSIATVKSRAAKALARLRDVPGLAEIFSGGVAP